MNVQTFLQSNLYEALENFFEQLNIPVNIISEAPTTPESILEDRLPEQSLELIKDIYTFGMVDNAAFEGAASTALDAIKEDYEGLLIFGVNLHKRTEGLLPNRTQLSDITRALNRTFPFTPVVVIFKYQDEQDNTYISFANAERGEYKQNWREGEKVGKVSLLKDIHIQNPHSGHLRILQDLEIKSKDRKKITSFSKLYQYWQDVFNTSTLNKKFYKELSNWYFWAIDEVKFPNPPVRRGLDEKQHKEAIKEHRGKNVIRLLTRLLFVWFIKEKKLIPEELFDPRYLQEHLLKEISTDKLDGLFKVKDLDSNYYRAILQNLFFATLNCSLGGRKFRGDGQHQNVTHLMRYQNRFKDSDHFVELAEKTVPFMNGGLFECLDKPDPTKKGRQGGDVIHYIDGFSDKQAIEKELVVPDFLFFDEEEILDLSEAYGSKKKVYKEAKTKGLFRILESYKFTIDENTPLEEEVALDPELLGRVFENLLASYNPETKTTARKQTGSFYTPREIVNYMVDESLMAYLKTQLNASDQPEAAQDTLDQNLRQLFSYSDTNPFENNNTTTEQIIRAIDHCKILDPACGSGAFPMGALQKMVHLLSKLDPKNERWKNRQIAKVETIEDSTIRDNAIADIENAFEKNELDYGRKLYLIQNCIYGVDIQPVAVQISKLRCFISLIVDQKVDKADKNNFGIRPLPNLETKFVAANTLIGLEKPKQGTLQNPKIEQIESKLQRLHNRIFSLKAPKRKRELRAESNELRKQLAALLEQSGWQPEVATQIAKWQPFNQNTSADFFDTEWMFGIKDGFDVVIGNPPYVFGGSEKISVEEKRYFKSKYKSGTKKINLFSIFIERGIQLLKDSQVLNYIIPNTFLRVTSYSNIREYVYLNTEISEVNDLDIGVFEGVTASTIIIRLKKKRGEDNCNLVTIKKGINASVFQQVQQIEYNNQGFIFDIFTSKEDRVTLTKVHKNSILLGEISRIIRFGVVITKNFDDVVFYEKKGDNYEPFLEGDEILSFGINYRGRYLLYEPKLLHRSRTPDVFENEKIMIQRITGGARPIKAVRDSRKFYNKESIINLQLNSDDYNYSYILAVLNSSIINWFYKQKFTNNSKLTVNLSKEYLEQIPIKKVDDKTSDLVSNISKFLELCINDSKKFRNLYSVLDSIILNIYLPDYIKKLDVEIVSFVEETLQSVLQSRDFEQCSPSEKEEIIDTLHQKWTSPNNEVRRRIDSFATKSPDILQPILEG